MLRMLCGCCLSDLRLRYRFVSFEMSRRVFNGFFFRFVYTVYGIPCIRYLYLFTGDCYRFANRQFEVGYLRNKDLLVICPQCTTVVLCHLL